MIPIHTASASLLSNLKARIGAYGGVNCNAHKVDFLMLPGIPNCCVEYGDANSLKYGFRIFAEVNVISFIDIQIGASYNKIGADLQSNEYIGNTEILDHVYPVFTTHHLEADIGVLAFSPSLSIMLYKNIPLRIGVGIETGIMVQKSIYQHEDLSEEAIENGVVFYDGSNDVGISRNKFNGDIPYTNNYNAISISAAYDIALSEQITIRPEINYKYCLNDIAASVNWKINTLSFGLSICYNLFPDKFDMEYLFDPILTDSIPDMVVAEQNMIRNEVENSQAFINDYTQQYMEEVNEEDIIINNNEKSTEFNCCYIIFYSTQSNDEAKSILEKLAGGMSDVEVYIQEWMNPDSEIIYFRIRTKCFDDIFKAMNIEDQYNKSKLIIEQPSLIKCY